MRTSNVLLSVPLGVVLALVLAAPLFVVIPFQFVGASWYFIDTQTAMWGFVGALAVLIGGGFAGGWASPEEGVRSGTTVGLMGSAFASVVLVVPALAIQATGESLRAYGATIEDVELRAVASEALVAGAWMPAAAFAVMLLVGAALGAVGGVLFDLYAGAATRGIRRIHRSSVPLYGLAAGGLSAVGAAVWAVHLAEPRADTSNPGSTWSVLGELGRAVTWQERSLLAAPLALAGLLGALFLAWAFRDAALLFKRRLRVFSTLWVLLATGIALTAGISVLVTWPEVLGTPVPYVSALLMGLASLAGMAGAAWSDAEVEDGARTFGQFLTEGLLVGMVSVGSGFAIGGTFVISEWLVVWPYAWPLIQGGAVPAPELPASVVWNLFLVHFASPGAMVAAMLAYVVMVSPVWLFVRAYAPPRD